MNRPYLEITREVSVLVVLGVLLPVFAYHSARIIIQVATGTPLWTKLHSQKELTNSLEELESRQKLLGIALSEEPISNEQRMRIEEEKGTLDKRLRGEKLSTVQREELHIQKKKVDEEMLSLQKKSDEQSKLDKAMQGRQELIYFLVTTLIGCIALAFGYLIPIGYLGAGLIQGGLLSLLLGFFSYWGYFNDWLKLLVLLLTLSATIYMGYRIASKKNT